MVTRDHIQKEQGKNVKPYKIMASQSLNKV